MESYSSVSDLFQSYCVWLIHEHTKLVLTSELLFLLFPLSPDRLCLISFHHLVLSSKIPSWEHLLTMVTEVASLPFTFIKSPNFIFHSTFHYLKLTDYFLETSISLMSISSPPTWISWTEASWRQGLSVFSLLTPVPECRGKIGWLSEWRFALFSELGQLIKL